MLLTLCSVPYRAKENALYADHVFSFPACSQYHRLTHRPGFRMEVLYQKIVRQALFRARPK